MSPFKFEYTGNLPWLEKNTVFLTVYGSRAYGTATEDSDWDYRGFAIPPKEYFLGFVNKFDQAEIKVPDTVIYHLHKFINLAALGNPNAVEVIYTDPSDWVICHPVAQKLIEIRDAFLSKKMRHSFSGFMMAQLKRIRGHREYLLHPIKEPPTRKEFGLPETSLISSDQLKAAQAAIQKQMDSWEPNLDGVEPATRTQIMNDFTRILSEIGAASEETKWLAAARTIGFNDNFIEIMNKERQYRARHTQWQHYQDWKKNRNPKRAAMEEKFGFDLKHGAQLYRLGIVCREILETGKVIVKRPDAADILAVKRGEWSYDRLVEWAESQDKEMEEVAKNSKLPHSPDRALLDRVCQEMVSEFLELTPQAR